VYATFLEKKPSYRQNKQFVGTTEKSIAFIIVFITLMLFAFLAWYFSHKARHKEMLMLIERGIDIEKVVCGKKNATTECSQDAELSHTRTGNCPKCPFPYNKACPSPGKIKHT